MKKSVLFAFVLFITPMLANASNAVPKYVTLQAVLTDDGGRIVSEQIQQSDFTFRIVDSSGNIIFEEEQKKVPVVRGAISVLVGSGTEGGIPIEALAPDGDKLLQVQMGNHTIPQEDLQLVSVPYAMYADAIAGGVDTDDIVNGTVTMADLSAELLASLGTLGDTSTEAITADLIPVRNSFANMGGSNVQSVFEGVDFALAIDKEDIKNIQKDITTIQSQQPTLAPGQKLDDIYVNVTGDTITGTLSATNFAGDGSQITNINGSNIQTNSITTTQIKDGTISLSDMFTTNISQWVNDTGYITDGNTNWDNSYGFITASEVPDNYVDITGDTISGDLTLNGGDIVMSGNETVDGVDIGTLKTTVDDHGTRLDTLEANASDPTPSYFNVQVTGSAPSIPVAHTLYKNNLPIAWASVSGNGGGNNVPYFKSDFNFSKVERDTNFGCGYGMYKLTFSTPPTSSTSYVVVATMEGGGSESMTDTVIVIYDKATNYFHLSITEGASCKTDVDFQVVVFGY